MFKWFWTIFLLGARDGNLQRAYCTFFTGLWCRNSQKRLEHKESRGLLKVIILSAVTHTESDFTWTVKQILNNYWMRLSMISWIVKSEVCVICRSRRLRQIIQTRGFDNSWYHEKTEFNNCFITHFLNNRQKKTFICWKMALFQN